MDGGVVHRRRGRPSSASVAERREKVRQLADLPVSEIADRLDMSRTQVHNDLRALGIAATSQPRDMAAERVEDRAKAARRKVSDRRRFKTTNVPFGNVSTKAPPETEGTIFPTRRARASAVQRVLIDGKSNSKIGGDVLVGRLKGAKIFTLTLEERATCPRSCPLWEGCYGNAMQHPVRLQPGPDLEEAIAREVHALIAKHGTILIRLHVLGDFYSREYVALWLMLLREYEGLHVFGFTAHRENTAMGAIIAAVRGMFPDRFMVRHSGRGGPWGSFTLDFPTELPLIGDAVVCPEQRDAMDGTGKGLHCGACGLCWKGPTPIAFVLH